MKDISLRVDGIEIKAEAGQNILQASLDAGIYIPHICSHPDLSAQGDCKLCVVELGGETVLSCQTQAEEGMEVVTKTDHLQELRGMAMELMLADHPHDCTSCKVYLNCELQAMMQYLGTVHARMRDIHRSTTSINTSNPIIIREMERCIKCGRCVRACDELRGVGILEYRRKDGEVYIGTKDDKPLTEADCRFCGACVAVCPTGSLQMNTELVDKYVIPCQTACPAGIDIPGYIRLTKEGKYSEASALIRQKVPFPLALGYVCNNLCEEKCRRKELNESVSIRELKRFAAANDKAQIWKKNHHIKEATGKKVAVIGSGVAGMTSAYYLQTAGHEVTVYERLPVAGGMMSTGIPEYRLPRDVVKNEIDTILESGVKLITSSNIESVDDLLGKPYDAVCIATGASVGKKIPFPGADSEQVYSALDVLRSASLGEPVKIGKEVIVLGGGNVAFDAARVCVRLGAEKVNLLCLEPEGGMLADDEEISEGTEEGIVIHNSKSTLSIEQVDGKVRGVRCIDVESFSFGPGGKLELKTREGSEQTIPSDTIVFAVGQRTDMSEAFGAPLTPFGYVAVKEGSCATEKKGVFAAGDIVTGTKFLIQAIEHGREAASEIDIYLGGSGDIEEVLVEVDAPDGQIGKQEGFHSLNREYVGHTPVEERRSTFTSVCSLLDEDQAHHEAERCLQCDLRNRITKTKFWTEYIK